jgi:hypothetical protein
MIGSACRNNFEHTEDAADQIKQGIACRITMCRHVGEGAPSHRIGGQCDESIVQLLELEMGL